MGACSAAAAAKDSCSCWGCSRTSSSSRHSNNRQTGYQYHAAPPLPQPLLSAAAATTSTAGSTQAHHQPAAAGHQRNTVWQQAAQAHQQRPYQRGSSDAAQPSSSSLAADVDHTPVREPLRQVIQQALPHLPQQEYSALLDLMETFMDRKQHQAAERLYDILRAHAAQQQHLMQQQQDKEQTLFAVEHQQQPPQWQVDVLVIPGHQSLPLKRSASAVLQDCTTGGGTAAKRTRADDSTAAVDTTTAHAPVPLQQALVQHTPATPAAAASRPPPPTAVMKTGVTESAAAAAVAASSSSSRVHIASQGSDGLPAAADMKATPPHSHHKSTTTANRAATTTNPAATHAAPAQHQQSNNPKAPSSSAAAGVCSGGKPDVVAGHNGTSNQQQQAAARKNSATVAGRSVRSADPKMPLEIATAAAQPAALQARSAGTSAGAVPTSTATTGKEEQQLPTGTQSEGKLLVSQHPVQEALGECAGDSHKQQPCAFMTDAVIQARLGSDEDRHTTSEAVIEAAMALYSMAKSPAEPVLVSELALKCTKLPGVVARSAEVAAAFLMERPDIFRRVSPHRPGDPLIALRRHFNKRLLQESRPQVHVCVYKLAVRQAAATQYLSGSIGVQFGLAGSSLIPKELLPYRQLFPSYREFAEATLSDEFAIAPYFTSYKLVPFDQLGEYYHRYLPELMQHLEITRLLPEVAGALVDVMVATTRQRGTKQRVVPRLTFNAVAKVLQEHFKNGVMKKHALVDGFIHALMTDTDLSDTFWVGSYELTQVQDDISHEQQVQYIEVRPNTALTKQRNLKIERCQNWRKVYHSKGEVHKCMYGFQCYNGHVPVKEASW